MVGKSSYLCGCVSVGVGELCKRICLMLRTLAII